MGELDLIPVKVGWTKNFIDLILFLVSFSPEYRPRCRLVENNDPAW